MKTYDVITLTRTVHYLIIIPFTVTMSFTLEFFLFGVLKKYFSYAFYTRVFFYFFIIIFLLIGTYEYLYTNQHHFTVLVLLAYFNLFVFSALC